MAIAMSDEGLDQSALARLVGCTPGAINQIASGNVHRSKFLPDIADALKVSLRWLRGEDVPRDPTAPIVRPAAPPQNFQFVAMQVALPSEGALEQMFEALLGTIDEQASRAEVALLLAQRLPIGLSHLQDLRPDMARFPASHEQSEVGAASPAKRDRVPTS